ncbi:hypothetical protein BUE80_DR013970, partial [Diplocarpon rosae]
MEPVPETERMEEFKTTAVPTLRLLGTNESYKNEQEAVMKPPTIRRSTEPTPTSPLSPISSSPSVSYRLRRVLVFPGLPTRGSREALRNISEMGDISHDHTPGAPERSASPVMGLPHAASFRSKRPSSPLRYLAQQNATAASTAPSTPSFVNSSPPYSSYRFNDALL